MRIKILLLLFLTFWLVLLVRIYYISIKSNTYYEELSKQNSIKTEDLTPLRGSILDRNAKPLSVNKLGFSVAIKPQLSSLRKKEILDKEINFLVKSIEGLEFEKLRRLYTRRDSPYSHSLLRL